METLSKKVGIHANQLLSLLVLLPWAHEQETVTIVGPIMSLIYFLQIWTQLISFINYNKLLLLLSL